MFNNPFVNPYGYTETFNDINLIKNRMKRILSDTKLLSFVANLNSISDYVEDEAIISSIPQILYHIKR